jgi:zinc transporter, ZIP family
VTLGRTLLLGAIAGGTILLGMPLGRLRKPVPMVRLALTAVAIGVLLFLVWDVLSAAYEPIDAALGKVHDHTGGLAPVWGYGSLFAGGLVVGLMSLVYYERVLARRASPAPAAGAPSAPSDAVAAARRLALMIAIGIGLHNFGEGLAIGGSAARNEVGLATILVIGFALHNATEGFGITAPLAAAAGDDRQRPSWPYLLGLAAIGGGPTFIGTWVGHAFTSDALSVVFLTLAAGSILYVVIQLLGMTSRANRRDILCWGLLLGLMAGFVTDFVVTAGGA